jgi:hypothetical protein
MGNVRLRRRGLIEVLRELLKHFSALGGQILCLYRQFYIFKVVHFLIEEKDIPLEMEAPKEEERKK